jgi:hypothetical protein
MPCLYSCHIGGVSSIALRVPDLDGPVRIILDVALAYLFSKAHQVLFLAPLVHHEEYVDLIERIDRLHRHVFGIARPNADDKNLSHLRKPSGGRRSGPAAALRSIYDPSLVLRNVDPWDVIAQRVEHGNS